MLGTGSRDHPFIIDEEDLSHIKAVRPAQNWVWCGTVGTKMVLFFWIKADPPKKNRYPNVIDLTADDDGGLDEALASDKPANANANKKRKSFRFKERNEEGARDTKRARPLVRIASTPGHGKDPERRRIAGQRGREKLRQEMAKEETRAVRHARKPLVLKLALAQQAQEHAQKRATSGRGIQASYQKAMDTARTQAHHQGHSGLRRVQDQRPPEIVILDRQLTEAIGNVFG